MKNLDDILLISQTRLSSSRCPRKSIRPFFDTTLTDLICEKFERVTVLNKSNIYFAAHEQELKEIVGKYRINLFHRSANSVESEGDAKLIYEWHKHLPFRYFVFVNSCSPFLKSETIESFINEFVTSSSESLFGVFKKQTFYWDENKEFQTKWPEGESIMNTRKVEPRYEAAHCLYGGRLDLIEDGIWMARAPYQKNAPALFEIAQNECLDIDYEWQFEAYSKLYKSMVTNRLD